jgi:hypothetical protein
MGPCGQALFSSRLHPRPRPARRHDMGEAARLAAYGRFAARQGGQHYGEQEGALNRTLFLSWLNLSVRQNNVTIIYSELSPSPSPSPSPSSRSPSSELFTNILHLPAPSSNLLKTGDMDTGTVSFKNEQKVRRFHVPQRENAIVNRLAKTKTERIVDHEAERVERIKEEGRRKRLAANERVSLLTRRSLSFYS